MSALLFILISFVFSSQTLCPSSISILSSGNKICAFSETVWSVASPHTGFPFSSAGENTLTGRSSVSSFFIFLMVGLWKIKSVKLYCSPAFSAALRAL